MNHKNSKRSIMEVKRGNESAVPILDNKQNEVILNSTDTTITCKTEKVPSSQQDIEEAAPQHTNYVDCKSEIPYEGQLKSSAEWPSKEFNKFTVNDDIKTEEAPPFKQDLEEPSSQNTYYVECKSEIPYELNIKSSPEWAGNELNYEIDLNSIKQEPGVSCIDSKEAGQDINIKTEIPSVEVNNDDDDEQEIKDEELILKQENEDLDDANPIESEPQIMDTTDNDKQCMKQSGQLSNKIHNCLEKRFRTAKTYNLQRHMAKHKLKTKGSKFKCEHCVYSTNRKWNLATHIKTHSSTKPLAHVCAICDKTFARKDTIDAHILRYHYDNEQIMATITHKIHECQQCSYKCVPIGNFRNHLEWHKAIQNDLKKFRCEHCSYSTYNKNYLTRHLIIHGDTQYVCAICSKSFKRKILVDSHIISKHSDDKQLMCTITSKLHKCQQCSYECLSAITLKRHIILKHNEDLSDLQQFKCGHCAYSTYLRSELIYHLGSHRKPYVCKICSDSFNAKVQIDCHILNKHPNNQPLMATITQKIHECQQCSYKCITSLKMKYHLLKHTET